MRHPLILYVGLHKTASSSIQATCGANQSLLRERGFIYPVFAMENDQSQVNHTRMLRNLFRHAPDRIGLDGRLKATLGTWTKVQRENLKVQLAARLLSAGGCIVLAAEGLSTYSEDELSQVRSWLDSNGFDTRVICHVRHLSPWLNSMIAQRVRGQFGYTIEEAVGELASAGGLVKPRIETVKRVFPQAEFFSHEAAVAHPNGPAGFFLETIGLDDFTGLQWKRANEGSSDLAVRTRSQINERFGRARWQGPVDDYERFTGQRGILAIDRVAGPKFRLLESEVRPIVSLVANENDWLLREFGPAFHDVDPGFPQAIADASEDSMASLTSAIQMCGPRLREYLHAQLNRPAPQAPSPAPSTE